MHPRAMRLTRRPVLPRRVYSMRMLLGSGRSLHHAPRTDRDGGVVHADHRPDTGVLLVGGALPAAGGAAGAPSAVRAAAIPTSTTPVAPGVITSIDSRRSMAKAEATSSGADGAPTAARHAHSSKAWNTA